MIHMKQGSTALIKVHAFFCSILQCNKAAVGEVIICVNLIKGLMHA